MGDAFICNADDECGTNLTSRLAKFEGTPANQADDRCRWVGRGILSDLIVGLDDDIIANLAGPTEKVDTLIQLPAGEGEVESYRRSWRENY